MVHFDEALDVALTVIRERLGRRRCSITFVRDVTGQLTTVLPDGALQGVEWDAVAQALDAKLGPHSSVPRLCCCANPTSSAAGHPRVTRPRSRAGNRGYVADRPAPDQTRIGCASREFVQSPIPWASRLA